MVGDSLDPATPYENVQSKILIDATTIPMPILVVIQKGQKDLPNEIHQDGERGKENRQVFQMDFCNQSLI